MAGLDPAISGRPWTRGSSPRVTEGSDYFLLNTEFRVRGAARRYPKTGHLLDFELVAGCEAGHFAATNHYRASGGAAPLNLSNSYHILQPNLGSRTDGGPQRQQPLSVNHLQ